MIFGWLMILGRSSSRVALKMVSFKKFKSILVQKSKSKRKKEEKKKLERFVRATNTQLGFANLLFDGVSILFGVSKRRFLFAMYAESLIANRLYSSSKWSEKTKWKDKYTMGKSNITHTKHTMDVAVLSYFSYLNIKYLLGRVSNIHR